jgi:FMN-dependent NADH-azoreductase
MKQVQVGLVKGRHDLPVENYIFEEIQDVMEFDRLKKEAYQKLNKVVTELGENDKIVVYVTGLTAATIAVVNAWLQFRCQAGLVFRHYDRETGSWKTHEVEKPVEFSKYYQNAAYGI